jgi:hypothetical protein
MKRIASTPAIGVTMSTVGRQFVNSPRSIHFTSRKNHAVATIASITPAS